jgi:uncharacterized protein YceK
MKKAINLLVVISVISGCSTISKLTIKEYTNSSGHKVTAGRYKPEADNQCQQRKKLSASWGFQGRLDPDARYDEIVMQAVDRASALNANYVYVVVPTGISDRGDVDASVADIYYYHCKNQPN